MTHFRLLFLLIATPAALTAPPVASAASPELSVTVQQNGGGPPVSYLIAGAEAGQRVRAGTVIAQNDGERPVAVAVYPVAAVTATNLGSAYALRGEASGGPSAWTRSSERALELAPGESTGVEVVVEVPDGQADGEYLSGLAIEARGQTAKRSTGGEVAVANAQRYVVGVQANVGEASRPKLVFDGADIELQPAGVTFLLEMRNPGNVILQDVRGRIEVERDGRRVVAQPIGPGTFVTGTEIDFPVLARREAPPEGTEYRVRAVARYHGGEASLDEIVTFGAEAAERQEQFGGPRADGDFPWLWILPALVALALLALALRRRRGRLPSLTETLALIERLPIGDECPLTLVAVAPLPPGRRERKRLREALLARTRTTDVLCEPQPETYVIVAPNTSELIGVALAEDLERTLRVSGDGVGEARVETAVYPVAAIDLLAAVLARNPLHHGMVPGDLEPAPVELN